MGTGVNSNTSVAIGKSFRSAPKEDLTVDCFAYVLVTPVRNEEAYLQHTIDSVASQTVLPRLWLIVDDGSTDATPSMVEAAAKKHPWIRLVRRADRGFRKPGGGVIEAFYDGYDTIGQTQWDYVVKLDGDLSFDPTFFARSLQRFIDDPKLGIGGGTVCHETGGALVVESSGDPPFHVRGATKIYRRSCWEAIGGLLKAPGWDTLDELKANMLGWNTYSFPELKMNHYRWAGGADGTWKNWVKNGRANYVTGYHPLFMLMKCIARLRQKPYGIISAALWWGFVSGYIKRLQQVEDPALIRYVRKQQIRRLTRRSSLWSKGARNSR